MRNVQSLPIRHDSTRIEWMIRIFVGRERLVPLILFLHRKSVLIRSILMRNVQRLPIRHDSTRIERMTRIFVGRERRVPLILCPT